MSTTSTSRAISTVPAGGDVGDADGASADADGEVSAEGDAGAVVAPFDCVGEGVAARD